MASAHFPNNGKLGASYADAVKGVRCRVGDCFSVPKEVVVNNSSWLSNSLLGTVRWEGVIPSILGIYEVAAEM